MDNRLIPPSHFDPNERDLLENSCSSSQVHLFPPSTHVLQIQPPLFQNIPHPATSLPKVYLKPPGEFSSSSGNSGQDDIASLGPNQDNMKTSAFFPMRGAQRPSMHATQNSNALDQNIPHSNKAEQHHDLVKLQAENEALKAVIQYKTSHIQLERQITKPDSCTMHEAVIEHQTKHIARLQKDIEGLASRLAKSESDITECKTTIASKDRDIKEKSDLVKEMQHQLEVKENKEKVLRVEKDQMENDIKILKDEKLDLLESHKTTLKEAEKHWNGDKSAALQHLDMQLKLSADKHREEILSWQERMKSAETKHTDEISSLKKLYEEEKESMKKNLLLQLQGESEKCQQLRQDLETSQNQVKVLSERIKGERSEKEDLQSIANKLQSDLSSSVQLSEKYAAQINQLQNYIGEQQKEDCERSRWKSQKGNLEGQILNLQNEKEELNKTLELQAVRLQSVSKILSTQEDAIHANAKALSVGNLKGNPERVIIRKWREKVFELMVQCKSSEITSKAVENKWKLVKDQISNELEEEQRVTVILENQLSECRAQHEMSERENSSLINLNKKLTEELNSSLKKSSELEEALMSMSENVARAISDLAQQFQVKFSSVAEKNIRLEQRISFANNRLRTIQDLLVRRNNLWKAKIKQLKEDSSFKSESSNQQKTEEDSASQIRNPDLFAEISQLTNERDKLSQRLMKDSAIFENATTQFHRREEDLERNMTMLQHELQDKSEEIADLKKQLDGYEEKLRDCEHAAADAKEEMRQVRENHSKDVESKLDEVLQKWESEKREIEMKLNEAQREHARAVVSLRQSERNSVREKKRAGDNMEALSHEHEREVQRMRRKIKVLQQDNNLLMTTLRQQGLISTFKSARSKAVKLSSDIAGDRDDEQNGKTASKTKCVGVHFIDDFHPLEDDNEPQKEGEDEETDKELAEIPIQTKTGESRENRRNIGGNVEEILKDLVVLTEEILGDKD